MTEEDELKARTIAYAEEQKRREAEAELLKRSNELAAAEQQRQSIIARARIEAQMAKRKGRKPTSDPGANVMDFDPFEL